MCEVDFNYKSKLERHLGTDKHAALAGITNITDAQVDNSPSVTSVSTVIETELDMEPEVYRLALFPAYPSSFHNLQ